MIINSDLLRKTSLLRFILTCLFIYVSSVSVLAQRSTKDINRVGDEYFNTQQYYKATLYYQESMGINRKDVWANLQMGHCSRYLFQYPEAEHYYQRVVESSLRRYPEALYYFALVQKLNGKYDAAIENFAGFIAYYDNKESPVITEEAYGAMREQARVDKEGCILALKQLTHPFKELDFKNVGGPVNTEYHDYAASEYRGDQGLVITSGRKGGKGSLTNQRFGESFTDNYRFVETGGTWAEVKEKDNFKVNNTKWGDGAGEFNAAQDKFYFTRCDAKDGEECHIYYSELKGGKWTEAVPLNRNINVSGYSSKQPAITPQGDTLFFSSNRPNGLGGTDIWMSISSGNNNWGPAINLGEQINTELNEISPYFGPAEKALFFSSDGHRGFGGFDIYMAKGFSLFAAEVYNLGPPFNSNRDDCYYYLGNQRGYLSSNRKGGNGNFDVYSFKIITRQKIVADINNQDAIAGRNSLYSDDYEFETDEPVTMEKIMSKIMANRIADTDVPLTQTEILFFDTLSNNDQDRMDRIVNSRIRNLSESDLAAMRDEDELYYQNLSGSERERTDRMIDEYLNDKGMGEATTLNTDDESFYRLLPLQERQRLDRVITDQVAKAESSQAFGAATEDVYNYEQLAAEERKRIDRIAAAWLAAKESIDQSELSTQDRNYYNSLSAEEKARIDRTVQYRLRELYKKEGYQANAEELAYYQQLSTEERKRIDRLAQAYLKSEPGNAASYVAAADRDYYRALPQEAKNRTDRLLARKLRNQSDADRFYYQTLQSEEQERINKLASHYAEARDLDKAFMQLSPEDQKYFMSLPPEERARIDRVAVARANELNNTSPASTAPATSAASVTEAPIARAPATSNPGPAPAALAPASVEDGSSASLIAQAEELDRQEWSALENELSGEAKKYYQSLPPEDKRKVQRMLQAGLKKLSNEAVDYYMDLSEEERNYVNELSAAYLSSNGTLSQATQLSVLAKRYYDGLNPNDRAMVEEFMLSTSNNLDAASLAFYREESNAGRQQLGDVAKTYWTSEAPEHSPKGAMDYYNTLPPEVKRSIDTYNSRGLKTASSTSAARAFLANLDRKTATQVAQIIGTALQTNGDIVPQNLSDSDRRYFQSLSPSEQEVLQEIVNASLFDLDLIGLMAYMEMEVEQKRQIGQLAADNFINTHLIKARRLPAATEDYYVNLSLEDKARVNRMMHNGLARMEQQDREWYQQLSDEDKAHVANLLKTHNATERPATELDRYLQELPLAEKVRLEQLVDRQLAQLSQEEKSYYNQLPPEEQKQVRRYLLARYLQTSGASEVVANDADQQYYQQLPPEQKNKLNRLAETVTAKLLSNQTDLLANSSNRPAASDRVGLTPGEEGKVNVTLNDLDYYQKLDTEEKRKVNRIIAHQLLAQDYESDPTLFNSDKQYYERLDPEERDRVRRIARSFHAAKAEAHSYTASDNQYYENLPPEKRERVNRLIVLLADGSMPDTPTRLREQDNKYLQSLEAESKLRVRRLATLRKAAARIQGDDIEKDLKSLEQSDIVADINSFEVKRYNTVTVSGQLIEINSGRPAAGVEIPLVDSKGEVLKYTTTNQDGTFRYVNLPANENYRILADSRVSAAEEVARYFIKDLTVLGTERITENIKFENIYFNLNEHKLRPEAYHVLEELAALLKSRPDIQVEINAYTDFSGTDVYNLELSAKRGEAAFDYLVGMGIDRTALIINGKGKASPIASNDSEFGRQLNRRVEFNIFGDNINYNPKYTTYIVKPGATMYSIARAYQMTTDEIRSVNGMVEGDILAAYEPVRLKIIAEAAVPQDMIFNQRVYTGKGFTEYAVQKGDTLYSIAEKFGIPEELLLEVNGLSSVELTEGQILQIYNQ